jgi:hypothetical protein
VNAIPDRALLRQALRQDLPSFIHRSFQLVSPGAPFRHNWHLDAIAWHLRQCFERRVRRLVITMPPRNLKSICASVAFPAWALGQDPTLRFVAASYSQELAAKHARDCRAVLQSPWYRQAFPRTRLDPAKNTESSSRPPPGAGACPPRSAARSPAAAATSSSSTIP